MLRGQAQERTHSALPKREAAAWAGLGSAARGEGPADTRKASQETAPRATSQGGPLTAQNESPGCAWRESGGHLPSSQKILVEVLTNQTLLFSPLKTRVQKAVPCVNSFEDISLSPWESVTWKCQVSPLHRDQGQSRPHHWEELVSAPGTLQSPESESHAGLYADLPSSPEDPMAAPPLWEGVGEAPGRGRTRRRRGKEEWREP